MFANCFIIIIDSLFSFFKNINKNKIDKTPTVAEIPIEKRALILEKIKTPNPANVVRIE